MTRPVHYWDVRDPRPIWACNSGSPTQGQEQRQTTDPRAVTCKRCRRYIGKKARA